MRAKMSWKTKLLPGLVLATSVSSTAYAADPPPVGPDWTGLYIGASVGYNWASGNLETSASPVNNTADNALDVLEGLDEFYTLSFSETMASAAGLSGEESGSGFIGGLHFGYNHQFSDLFVGGFEVDGMFPAAQFRAKGSATEIVCYDEECADSDSEIDQLDSTTQISSELNFLSTLRARAGFLVSPELMVYGTGGLAIGQLSTRTTVNQEWSQVYESEVDWAGPYSINKESTDWQAGFTIGGGGEWMVSDHMILRAQYLYYDLGSNSSNSGTLVANGYYDEDEMGQASAKVKTKTSSSGSIVTVGASWKF